MIDNILGLEHSEEFVQMFKLLYEAGWEDFLTRWEQKTAMQVASAEGPEALLKVKCRVLMIGELRNLGKNLLTIDKQT